ncbi:hypothetical protein OURE66S_02115 [Oligella ureolytica]
MAKIKHSVYTSHVPAIGAALDLGKSKNHIGRKSLTATNSPSNGKKK